MTLLVWAVLVLSAQAPEPSNPKDAARLASLVGAVRAADYRGERAELDRLTADVLTIKDPVLTPYRSYWAGFAKWRRALNGFNETPMPPDLETDLLAAIGHFESALLAKPDWIEARIGIVGCAGPLFFLAQNDAPKRDALLKTYVPTMREVNQKGADNPRALWLQGQNQLAGGGNPLGPRPAVAAETFHRGIEGALAEARETSADEPPWIPRWGGAENLMNLAYLYVHSALANREMALAYAEGALVAAPDWHYVRDLLLKQIRAMDAKKE